MIGNYGFTATIVQLLVTTALLGPVTPGSPNGQNLDRDKTGTAGCENGTKNPQTSIFAGSAGMASQGAERGGF